MCYQLTDWKGEPFGEVYERLTDAAQALDPVIEARADVIQEYYQCSRWAAVSTARSRFGLTAVSRPVGWD